MFRTAAALIILATIPLAAQAAERETHTIQVSLQGINPNTPAGQAQLRTRLKAAARLVCGNADSGSLAERADMANCRAQALATATLHGTELAAR